MGILQSAPLHDTCADDGLNILRLECPSRSSTAKRPSAQTNTVNEDRVIYSASNCVCRRRRRRQRPGDKHRRMKPNVRPCSMSLVCLCWFRCWSSGSELRASVIDGSNINNLWWLTLFLQSTHLSRTDILEEICIFDTCMAVFSHLDNVITPNKLMRLVS